MLSDAPTLLFQQPWWSACWIILPWEQRMGVPGPHVSSSRGKSFLTMWVVWPLSGLPRKGAPGPWCVYTPTRSEVPMTRMGGVGEGVWKGYSKVPSSDARVEIPSTLERKHSWDLLQASGQPSCGLASGVLLGTLRRRISLPTRKASLDLPWKLWDTHCSCQLAAGAPRKPTTAARWHERWVCQDQIGGTMGHLGDQPKLSVFNAFSANAAPSPSDS